MRQLHGVTALLPDRPVPLKQQALLFDQLHLVRPEVAYAKEYRDVLQRQTAECDFLYERGVIAYISKKQFNDAFDKLSSDHRHSERATLRRYEYRQLEQFKLHHEMLYLGKMEKLCWKGFHNTLAGGMWNMAKTGLFDRSEDVGECVRLMANELSTSLLTFAQYRDTRKAKQPVSRKR